MEVFIGIQITAQIIRSLIGLEGSVLSNLSEGKANQLTPLGSRYRRHGGEKLWYFRSTMWRLIPNTTERITSRDLVR
jgi:hypothetical protein